MIFLVSTEDDVKNEKKTEKWKRKAEMVEQNAEKRVRVRGENKGAQNSLCVCNSHLVFKWKSA